MRTAIGQCESHEQRFDAENFPELRDERDAAALADECGVAVESLAQRTLSRFAHRGVWVGEIPRAAVAGGNFHRDAFGQILFQMRLRQFQNFLSSLFRNETEGQFRKRVTRNHRFCPLPLVPPADSVDLCGGPRPNAFH